MFQFQKVRLVKDSFPNCNLLEFSVSMQTYSQGIQVLNVYYILFVCIFSDTGGYVFGKFFGGIKLTKISPKKTISGAIGSFLFSSFTLFIFFYTSDLLLNAKYTFTYIVIITLFLSFISQVGDLIISIFKRKAKVKDTGSILPGHGGLLDRVDGMIFAIPVYMIVITLPYQL